MAELADFSPGSGHLHDCEKSRASEYTCTRNCASALFAIAQDMARALTRVAAVVDMWEPSNPHPTQGCVPCSLRDQVKQALEGFSHD